MSLQLHRQYLMIRIPLHRLDEEPFDHEVAAIILSEGEPEALTIEKGFLPEVDHAIELGLVTFTMIVLESAIETGSLSVEIPKNDATETSKIKKEIVGGMRVPFGRIRETPIVL